MIKFNKSYESPNFDKRPQEATIKHLILHYTACDFDVSLKYLVGSKAPNRVSSHYLINTNGEIFQLVDDVHRAWHAGSESRWEHDTNINSTSIGIEIVNMGHTTSPLPQYPKTQIESLKVLCTEIIERYAIRPRYVLGHSDVAIGRKIDPGEHFPWRELALSGIGLFPEKIKKTDTHQDHVKNMDGKSTVHAYQKMLRLYGYDCDETGILDEKSSLCIEAFQRHFCPERIDGQIHTDDMYRLHSLLEQIK